MSDRHHGILAAPTLEVRSRQTAQKVAPSAKGGSDVLIESPDLTFTMLLDAAGLTRRDVRLLRHKDGRYPGFPSLYALWRDQRPRFDAYQETQAFGDEPDLRAPIWASFVGLPGSTETLFVGMYEAELVGPLPADRPHPITGKSEPAGSCNLYRLAPLPILASYIGRLWIRWGGGYRQWVQRVDGARAGKLIVELRRSFSEDAFPGFDALILNLADIETIPAGWQAALTATRGIYLLTCPRTREQYVGMASGAGGFLARWRDYFVTGHGGNVALKSREASDYRVSILETVGSAATDAELMVLEARWKDKLQSREMGLNRN